MNKEINFQGMEELLIKIPIRNFNNKIINAFEIEEEKNYKSNKEEKKQYMILNYSPSVDVLDNGYNYFYQNKIKDIRKSICSRYSRAGDLIEINIETKDGIVPFYKRYHKEYIDLEIENIAEKIVQYYQNHIGMITKNKIVYKIWVEYFYDGQAIMINLKLLATGMKSDEYGDEIIGRYSEEIYLQGLVINDLKCLVQSINYDGLMDDTKLVESIVIRVEKKLRNVNLKEKMDVTDDFVFANINLLD